MTSIGIVVDVVTAMIPVTTGANKLVWAMIVILDMWEIKIKIMTLKTQIELQVLICT